MAILIEHFILIKIDKAADKYYFRLRKHLRSHNIFLKIKCRFYKTFIRPAFERKLLKIYALLIKEEVEKLGTMINYLYTVSHFVN